jgi:acylphosphatase
MIRLTAYISGRVQRVGYRAKVVSLAKEMGLAGIVQNRPDGRVLVIAEGRKKDLERFASSIAIKNALIDVDDLDAQYSQGSGQYSTFQKITGPNEVGERLDDGIEILKRMLDKQDQGLDKMDQIIGEIRGLRVDLKGYMDRRFKRIEADLAELKEMKAALKEKGLI